MQKFAKILAIKCVNDTGNKLTAVVIDTVELLIAAVNNTINIQLLIYPEIFENFEMALIGYSGARGNLFMNKTRSKKSRGIVPLNNK